MAQKLLRALTAATLILPVAMALQARADELPRVVSLNLCADAYLMAIAGKQQILALTPQSQQADVSAFAAQAAAYPISDGQIETLAALKPDVVIVSSYSDPLRNRLIAQLGIEIVKLDAANNFAAALREVEKLGAVLGRSAQAAAYIKSLQADMAELMPVSHHPRLMTLQRRNLTVGKGHILDEIIALAGGENLGRHSGAFMGRVSLEKALAAQADYILLNEAPQQAESRGLEFLIHPALAEAYPPHKRVQIDNNLLVCAGATTPRAVKALIDGLSR
ncbi:MAG: ABC transporter substrate-binding protein [Parvibaculales bacterium]